MRSKARDKAIGFVQDIPGGFVFEIANGWIGRRIHCISGRIATTSLVNGSSAEEYLDETDSEFELTLTCQGRKITLQARDFRLAGHQTPDWSDAIRTLELRLDSTVEELPVSVSVFYQVRAGENFISKWVRVHPCAVEDAIVRNVVIENLKLKEMVEGVVPQPRYLRTYDNHEDRVHSEPDRVNTAEPDQRFAYGDLARAVVSYWGFGEGLFFFTESLLGRERYHRPTGLVMSQRDHAALADGLVTGPAVIGAYSGPAEIGFKRYNEHLMRGWCVVSGKRTPVSWSTWMVTLAGNKALCASYDRQFLLEYIDYIKEAGFYDILHLDLGWEAGYPLAVNTEKFPNGMGEIARRAKEAAGLDMTYWVNPFSASYWKSKTEEEHPEYLVPEKVSGRSGATAICVMTDYFDYVKRRFVELVTELNARVIYWDGNDWSIPECTATNHDHRDQDELEVRAWKRLAELCEAAHEARPDLMFVCFSIPFDNHRLAYLDQEQISDTYSFPTVQSELIQRQQLYQMTFEHPYAAIWGSWYGVDWYLAGEENLTRRPLRELIHAEMSMIGNGLCQAGGAVNLKLARPEFMEFLRKLFAFRKRFEGYFGAYQHVLGFPDGKRVDGEGHFVHGKGFIVLVNPTSQAQEVRIPLDEPELELEHGKAHELTDWSNLERGIATGSAAIESPPEIELGPLEVRYIGVNVGG